MKTKVKPKRVSFSTIGCKLNFTETSTLSRDIEELGYENVSEGEPADIYIINTCSVTKIAENKFEKLVKSLKLLNPDSKIIAVGCYAELRPDDLSALPEVDMVLGNIQKYELVNYIKEIDYYENKLVLNSDYIEKKDFHQAFSTKERTRSFLKIQDGCDYFCSYCTIPLARGGSRSDSIENILATINEILQSDVKEIILTGVNIGDFKTDKGENLIDLLHELEKINDLKRIRLSSIEPDLVSKEIVDLVAVSKKILPHFHIPLQSGNDKILKLMRRKYKVEQFVELVEYIAEQIPDAGIGIDLIVGFPGETDEDFEQTFTLLESLPISNIHVFPYSERPNTSAIKLQGKVSDKVKEERRKRISKLAEVKKRTFQRSNFGHVKRALFERKNRNGFIHGLTDNYIKIKAKYSPELENQVCFVKMTELDRNGMTICEIQGFDHEDDFFWSK